MKTTLFTFLALSLFASTSFAFAPNPACQIELPDEVTKGAPGASLMKAFLEAGFSPIEASNCRDNGSTPPLILEVETKTYTDGSISVIGSRIRDRSHHVLGFGGNHDSSSWDKQYKKMVHDLGDCKKVLGNMLSQ